MTETTQQLFDPTDKMHFHLVLAEVIFETKRGGISSHRTQFMTQSAINHFPADRIHQLQNSAAYSVKQKLSDRQAEGFKVHDVLFLHMHYCGYLSHEEFYGKGMTAPAELTEADTSSAVEPTNISDGETDSGDNVIPMNRDR